MYDSGVKLVNDYTIIHSGLPSDNKTRNAHGVAICLDQTAAKVWKDSGSEWEAISERILKIRLKCSPIHMTVISIYAPVNPSNNLMADACDKFYEDLQETVNKISKEDMVVIMGDYNARVEEKQTNVCQCIGPFTVDKD
ncbi:unnamed protein product [Didymodactylos carnosus]|uniref:Endonuclease/exonuclease/phosphatase domain-containing protein n=1 Tax=Didymodactylos carnosus TaxID=1234261 RepID=A0A815L6S3_9BILA|nr:unnamed protein product [Didymodactylos carnosus]CAF4297243.1 unnamed protein product [Didymodactylos carnosus]